jgi:hypothetical protein
VGIMSIWRQKSVREVLELFRFVGGDGEMNGLVKLPGLLCITMVFWEEWARHGVLWGRFILRSCLDCIVIAFLDLV